MTIDALERELPPAVLLLGPDLDGMEAEARAAVYRHGAVSADLIVVPALLAQGARSLVAIANVVTFGPFKAVIIQMDDASEQAQNILLKVLEEPPPSVRFILIASKRPLPTIVSRCQVEIVSGEAQEPGPGGKVAAQVAAALKAARSADLGAIDAALTGWGAEHHSALEVSLLETAIEQGSDPRERWRARRLLGALSRYAGAAPRLAAHAALVTAIDGDHHD